MAMNTSGPISLAGSTVGQSIAIEVGQSAVSMISLNDTIVRTLAGVPSGAIIMPTNFYGKSLATNFVAVFETPNSITLGNNTCRYDSSGNMYMFLRETTLNVGYLYKFDTSYNLVWQKQLTTAQFRSFELKGTEIFVASGMVGYPGLTGQRLVITKLDLDGNITLSTIYQGGATTAVSHFPYFLQATNNGYLHVSFERSSNIGWTVVQTSNLAVSGNISVRNTAYSGGFVLNTANNDVITSGSGTTGFSQWLGIAPAANVNNTTQAGFSSGGASGPVARNPTTGQIFCGGNPIVRYSSAYVFEIVRTITPSPTLRMLVHNGTYLYGLNTSGTLMCFDNNLNIVWQKSITAPSYLLSIGTSRLGGLAIAPDGDLLIPTWVSNSTPPKVILIKTKADGSQLNSLNVTVGGINIQSVNVTPSTVSTPAATALTQASTNNTTNASSGTAQSIAAASTTISKTTI